MKTLPILKSIIVLSTTLISVSTWAQRRVITVPSNPNNNLPTASGLQPSVSGNRLNIDLSKYPFAVSPGQHSKTSLGLKPICKIFAVPEVVGVRDQMVRRQFNNRFKSGTAVCIPPTQDQSVIAKFKTFHIENMFSNQNDEASCIELARKVAETCQFSVAAIYQTQQNSKSKSLLLYKGLIKNVQGSNTIFTGTGQIELKKVQAKSSSSSTRDLNTSINNVVREINRNTNTPAPSLIGSAPVAIAPVVAAPTNSTVTVTPTAPVAAVVNQPVVNQPVVNQPVVNQPVVSQPSNANDVGSVLTQPGRKRNPIRPSCGPNVMQKCL